MNCILIVDVYPLELCGLPESPGPVANKVSELQSKTPALSCGKVSGKTWSPCKALQEGQRAFLPNRLASLVAFPSAENRGWAGRPSRPGVP